MESLVSPEILAYIVTGVIVLERLAKLIPDDATGLLGMVRKISKVLSAYVPNDTGKISTKGTTVPGPKTPPGGG
jgi:hypothetical protein